MHTMENYYKFRFNLWTKNMLRKLGIQPSLLTLNTLDEVMRFLHDNSMKGDYFEFGVANGWSFIRSYYMARKWGLLKGMGFHAFDSFQGLPDLSSKYDEGHPDFREGMYQYGREAFISQLQRYHLDMDRVFIHEGFYKDSLKSLRLDSKAAFIYIDCDLYTSTKDVFDFILPYVQNGTVISFDDWYAYRGNNNFGERKAFHEWLEQHKGDVFVTPLCDFRTFIVNRETEAL